MSYRVEIGGKADAQLAGLDTATGAGVERKIQWLADNAAGMVHRRLVEMPVDLAELCKLRVGDYRILYWIYPAKNSSASTASSTVPKSIASSNPPCFCKQPPTFTPNHSRTRSGSQRQSTLLNLRMAKLPIVSGAEAVKAMNQLVLICTLIWLSAALSYAQDTPPAGVPRLDEMAGTWLPMKDVDNPPDVNNFHDMLLVNRDLTSFFCYPDDWLWRDGKFSFGYPPVTLTIDGKEYPAEECRWYPYRALRRNANCAGLAVETDTRMINEHRAVLVFRSR